MLNKYELKIIKLLSKRDAFSIGFIIFLILPLLMLSILILSCSSESEKQIINNNGMWDNCDSMTSCQISLSCYDNVCTFECNQTYIMTNGTEYEFGINATSSDRCFYLGGYCEEQLDSKLIICKPVN